MDKFPICWKGNALGELTTEREALYTWFTARCRLPGKGIWCAWAVGEQGDLRLGVLEPCGDHAAIRRRFSDRMTMPLGRILRCELREVESVGQVGWKPMNALPFRTPWLCRQLQGGQGILTQTGEQKRFLAIPYAPQKPFPLVSLFCFARVQYIRDQKYVVFAFNKEEWPVFWDGDEQGKE